MEKIKNELLVKKKIKKKRVLTILFYIIMIIIVLAGFIKFNCTTEGKFDFEVEKCFDFSNGIGIYNKKLIDFNYEKGEYFNEKNCINGIYIYRIINYILIFTFLACLPSVLEECRKRIYNTNNLIITDKYLLGTKGMILKPKEFKIKLKDLKQIKIKKNIFGFIFDKEKLILVTNNQIIKLYFIDNVENIAIDIKTLAEENNAVFDENSYKEVKKKKIKNLKNVILEKIVKLKKIFHPKSEMEIKLKKVEKLKDSGEINKEEYIKLKEKILNENDK